MSKLPLWIVVATILLILFSWIGNAYSLPLESLLSADGIRWMVSRMMEHFADAPLAECVLFLLAGGVLNECGILPTGKRHYSLKQKRGLWLTLGLAVLVSVMFCVVFLYPSGLLLSVRGEMADSPFMEGLPCLLMVFVILLSNFYGLVSGRFLSGKDAVAAHLGWIRRGASFFFTAFFYSQWVAVVNYSHVMDLLPGDQIYWSWGLQAGYFILLVLHLLFPVR